MTATWSQNYLLFGERLAISAVITAAPVLTLLFLLSVLRKPARLAGVTGLAVTFILPVALAEYSMPVGMSLNGAPSGIAFSLFPLSWIVFCGSCYTASPWRQPSSKSFQRTHSDAARLSAGECVVYHGPLHCRSKSLADLHARQESFGNAEMLLARQTTGVHVGRARPSPRFLHCRITSW
jgi:hypothetical protein